VRTQDCFIKNVRLPDQCIDVVGTSGNESGLPLVLWACEMSRTVTDQKWRFYDQVQPEVFIDSVPIYGFHMKAQPSTAPMKQLKARWIVNLPWYGQSSQAALDSLCQTPKCVTKGHIGRGVPFAVLEGSFQDVENIVVKHQNVSFIEPDIAMHVDASGASHKARRMGGTQRQPLSWGLDRIDERSGTNGQYVHRADGQGVHIYITELELRQHI